MKYAFVFVLLMASAVLAQPTDVLVGFGSGETMTSDNFTVEISNDPASQGMASSSFNIFIGLQEYLENIINGPTPNVTAPSTPPSGGSGGGGAIPFPKFNLTSIYYQSTLSQGQVIFVYFNITNIGDASGYFTPTCNGYVCQWITTLPRIYVQRNETVQQYFAIAYPSNFTQGFYQFSIDGNYVQDPLVFGINLTDDLDFLISLLGAEGVEVKFYDLLFSIKNDDPICAGDDINVEIKLVSNNMPGQDIAVTATLVDSNKNNMVPESINVIYVGRDATITEQTTLSTLDDWGNGWFAVEGKIINFTDTAKASFYLEDCTPSRIEQVPVLGGILLWAEKSLTKPMNMIDGPFWWWIIFAIIISLSMTHFLVTNESTKTRSYAAWFVFLLAIIVFLGWWII